MIATAVSMEHFGSPQPALVVLTQKREIVFKLILIKILAPNVFLVSTYQGGSVFPKDNGRTELISKTLPF